MPYPAPPVHPHPDLPPSRGKGSGDARSIAHTHHCRPQHDSPATLFTTILTFPRRETFAYPVHTAPKYPHPSPLPLALSPCRERGPDPRVDAPAERGVGCALARNYNRQEERGADGLPVRRVRRRQRDRGHGSGGGGLVPYGSPAGQGHHDAGVVRGAGNLTGKPGGARAARLRRRVGGQHDDRRCPLRGQRVLHGQDR